ncbi:hypothetical protein [Flammeovirga pectinis]|uniref:hypothetical protein n=1 Tax=Flammeovirga pectinis TaxID=2494373 RepID=UPI0012D79E74|nr:hypothetical protein [Flammeovirga pectinis]
MKKLLLVIVPVALLILDIKVIDSTIHADSLVGMIYASITVVIISIVTLGSYSLIKNS